MEFTPSPAELAATFDACLPDEPGIVRRKMFGWPAAFVGGWLFASLHRDSVVVRLPPAELTELVSAQGGRPFEPMPGRPMNGFAVLPARLYDDREALRAWIDRAYRAAVTLPPKAERGPAKRPGASRKGS